jgi:hypothetical protein
MAPLFSLFGWIAVISSSKLNTTVTLPQVLISFKDRVSWALPFQVKFVSKLKLFFDPIMLGQYAHTHMCKPKIGAYIAAGSYIYTHTNRTLSLTMQCM